MKKRLISILLSISFIISLVATAQFTAFAASGSWIDYADVSWFSSNKTEFTLTAAAQLAGLSKLKNSGTSFAGKTIKLGGNIDISARYWVSIGVLPNSFDGTFDGQGFTVSGMTINSGSSVGFFGGNKGVVKNLTLGYISVTSTLAGGLAYTNSGVISDCLVSGNVSSSSIGSRLGGIAAINTGTIENSSFGGSVKVTYTGTGMKGGDLNCILGGIAGWSSGGKILGCTNNGSVELNLTIDSSVDSSHYTGGIVGVAQAAAVITGCKNWGAVKSSLDIKSLFLNITTMAYTGGIVGSLEGGSSVQICTNGANVAQLCAGVYSPFYTVRTNGNVGGIAGINRSGCSISNSVGAVTVAFSWIYPEFNPNYDRRMGEIFHGRLAGVNQGTVKNCYWQGASGNSVTKTTRTDSSNASLGGTKSSIGRYSDYTGTLTPTDGTTLAYGNNNLSALNAGIQLVFDGSPIYIFTDIFFTPFPYHVTNWSNLADTSWYSASASSFTISGARQLAGLSNLVNRGTSFAGKTVYLDASGADLTPLPWTRIGGDGNPFNGTFIGVGTPVIKGLNIDEDADYQGLFGNVSGTVSNIELKGVKIRGGKSTGGVAGYVTGTISNCSVSGSVTGKSDAGGIVGYSGGNVKLCAFSGAVNGEGNVGGIAGRVGANTVDTCLNTGTINGTGPVGGIAGYQTGGAIVRNCRNEGTVNAGAQRSGGITGLSESAAKIQNSHNGGTVFAKNGYAGGIVGGNGTGATVENCYNIGRITGSSSIGALAGQNSGTLKASYFLAGSAVASIGAGSGTVQSLGSFADNTGTLTSANGTTLINGTTLLGALGAGRGSDTSLSTWKTTEGLNGGYPTLTALKLTTRSWTDEGFYETGWYNASASTFTIDTASKLSGFMRLVNSGINFLGKTVNLGADIDISLHRWDCIGNTAANAFKGTFDGQGHFIVGVALKASLNYSGLFGYNAGTIKNLGLRETSVAGSAYTGGVAGQNTGKILNCYVSGGTVAGSSYVGGIAGQNYTGGSVDNCYVAAAVSGSSYVGGIVGHNAPNSVVNYSYFLSGPAGAVGKFDGGTKNSLGRFSNSAGALTATDSVSSLLSPTLLAALSVRANALDSSGKSVLSWVSGGGKNAGYPIYGEDKKALTQFLASMSDHVVTVLNKSSASPIQGAKVTIGTNSYTTGADGTAVCGKGSGLNTVRVTAPGYKTCQQYYIVSPGEQRYIFLEEGGSDGRPYITIACDMTNHFDIRTQQLAYTFGRGAVLELSVSGDWNGNPGSKYVLYQESVKGAPGKSLSSESGSFSFAPGLSLNQDQPVFLKMVSSTGIESKPVALQIFINKPSDYDSAEATISKNPQVDATPSSSGSAASADLSKIFPTSFYLPLNVIGLKFYVCHNMDGTIALRGIVGAMKKDEDMLSAILTNTNGWDDFKKVFDTAKSNLGNETAINKLREDYGIYEKEFTVVENVVDGYFAGIGYFEIKFDIKGNQLSNYGEVLLTAHASGGMVKSFLVGPVPVYIELGGGLTMGASFGLGFSAGKSGVSLMGESNFVIVPYIYAGAGIGSKGLLSLGVQGDLRLRMVILPKNYGEVDAEASVKITLFYMFEWSWSIARKTWPVWGSKPKMALLGDPGSLGEDAKLTLTPRGYAFKTTPWNPGGPELKALAASGAANEKVLQRFIMPDASPQIVQDGDSLIMLFNADDSMKSAGNSTRLMYSVYDGVSWGSPAPVWENGTSDYYGSFVSAGSDIYAVWQKSKKPVEGADTNALLKETVSGMEICVAKWNRAKKSFEEAMFVTDNSKPDMLPTLVSNGDRLSAVWVQSGDNNLADAFSAGAIMRSDFEDEKWSEPVELFRTENYISELAAGYSGEELYCAYATINGDDGPDIWMLNGSSEMPVSGKNAASALRFNGGRFYWNEDGRVVSFDPYARKWEQIELAGGGRISSSYRLVEGGGKTAVVWAEPKEQGYLLKASLKNETGWSPAIALVGIEQDIQYYDISIGNDGTWRVVMNTYKPTGSFNTEQEHSLVFYSIPPKEDVGLSYVHVDIDRRVGKTQPVKYYVKNLGEKKINAISLRITGMPELNVPCSLAPGHTLELDANIDLSKIPQNGNVTVSVSSAGDSDASNNAFELKLGLVDVSLSLERHELDGKTLVSARLKNTSDFDTNTAVKVRNGAGGAIIAEKPAATIKKDKALVYLFVFDNKTLPFGSENNLKLYFTAETAEPDVNPFNDSGIVVVYKNTAVVPSGEPITESAIVRATGLSISGSHSITLNADREQSKTLQLTAVVTPSNATNKQVQWISSDQNIAFVSATGLVTAVSPGTVQITAKSHDKGFSDSVKVTVTDYYHEFSIESAIGGRIATGEAGLHPSGQKITITAEPYPGYRFAAWSSEGGGRFESAAKPSTIFEMPGADVKVTARFEALPAVNAKAPVIRTQPRGGSVLDTESITLEVLATAADEGSLSYQWYCDNKALPSATSSSLIIKGSDYSVGEHIFYVVIKNTNPFATGIKTAAVSSSSAAVTVIDPVKITSVSTGQITTIVSGCQANIPLRIEGECLDGFRFVFSIISPGGETVYKSAPVDAGSPFDTILNLDKSVLALPAGKYLLRVSVDGKASTADVPITVVPNLQEYWYMYPQKGVFEGKETLAVYFPNVGFAREIYGPVYVNNKKLSFIINGDWMYLPDAPVSGSVTVKVSGIKYPVLFPSFSLTFTETVTL